MKQVVAGILFICFFTPSLVKTEDGLPITVTAYSKLWSRYLGSNGGIFHDGPVSQSGLTIGWGDGFSVDFWGSYPLNGKDGFGKEFDLTLCKDTGFNKAWSLEVCLAWYHLTPKRFSDIISPTIKLARQFVLTDDHSLTASAKVEWYFPTGKLPTWGVLPEFKLTHAWKIANFLTLNHGPLLKPDHGAFGNDPTILGGYNADLSWKLNKHLTVQAPMMKFWIPMSKVRDGRKSEVVTGMGVTFDFDF